MIEENTYKLMLRIAALSLLMIGGVIAVWICLLWTKIDKNLIRARIFLNEKFLRKTWVYMFTGTTFFAIDQITVLLFGYYSEISILAEAFKVIFVGLIVVLLVDYYKLVKTCAK